MPPNRQPSLAGTSAGSAKRWSPKLGEQHLGSRRPAAAVRACEPPPLLDPDTGDHSNACSSLDGSGWRMGKIQKARRGSVAAPLRPTRPHFTSGGHQVANEGGDGWQGTRRRPVAPQPIWVRLTRVLPPQRGIGHGNTPLRVRAGGIDVAATVLDVAGLPEPSFVHGIQQRPYEGVSMSYTFDAADADDANSNGSGSRGGHQSSLRDTTSSQLPDCTDFSSAACTLTHSTASANPGWCSRPAASERQNS